MFRGRVGCAFLASTQMRLQSQSYHQHNIPFVEGEVQHAHRGGNRNAKKLDPDNIPHFVKCSILNDRREMGLTEVDDWRAFAEDAIYIPTRGGPLWVGPDDPRAEKLMKRKEKLLVKPGQVTRKMPKSDPAKDLENHPLRRFFTTPTNLSDPMSIATGLHQTGAIKSTDVKFTAGKIAYESRPPIVTIMGHVDHGKTTLLDYLRKSSVAAGEAGGITQNIGAFKVKCGDGFITFVDTPGHAAFNAMREAGAAITDVIIVIISAVDGVQPQTEEAIEIANKYGIPIVVAISKIDRRNETDHITSRLRELGVELEEEGGDVQLVKISSIEGTGIPDLLDALRLQAELSEVNVPVPCRAELSIVESETRAGNEVAAIVRCGLLKPGMSFVSGLTYGRIDKITDQNGTSIQRATAGEPVRFGGFSMLPKPGNILMQVSSDEHAKNFHLFMKDVYKAEGGREDFLQILDLESKGKIYDRKPDNNNIRAYDSIPFNLVVKAETFGMLQALLKTIYELPKLPGVALNVKITEVGGLKDADIALGSGANQPGAFLVFGKCRDNFFMQIPSFMHHIRFDVLYHGMDELKAAMVGALPKIKKTRVLASASCSQVFRASQAGKGNAAGVTVTVGALSSDAECVQVLRKPSKDDEPEVVYEGTYKELRRFKDVVPSVENGLECGLIVRDDFVFRVGDVIREVEHYEEDRDVQAEFEAAEKLERIMQLQAAASEETTAEPPAANTK